MTRIILASASPQRRKLIKILGLPFTIQPSRVKEKDILTKNVAHLVKHNALLKAKDVASRMRSGVVIGCDTVVFSHKKRLILKPKNFKEAKKNLGELMQKPHWVYSGLAVVDARSGKALVDYEKTKVFMTRLSPKEIDRYHAHVSPLDKAGGFDIEGRGALFIPRIEGCYFNVVGLPLAKLTGMLKKLGISVLSFLVILGVSGCETEYNSALHRQETLLFGDEKEKSLGASVALSVEKTMKIDTEVDINERVQKILKKIVAVCDRQELVYTIRVIDDDVMNAFSLPGGYVYIYKGLIDKMNNDDQLAGVIGHEVAHIVAKHALKRLQAAYGATILEGAAVATGNGILAAGIDLTASSLFFQNSREDEFQSDRLGVKYMKLAGYDPSQMKVMLVKILQEQTKKGPTPMSYWRTHPYIPLRIARVDIESNGKGQFKDYLNLTGEDK